jgi:hypothetical protein
MFRAARPGDPPPAARYREPNFQPAPRQPRPPARPAHSARPPTPPPAPRGAALTAAARFWYALMNIGFGAGYFAKIPAKRALADAGLASMTPAESFWYALMCVPLGAGYFVKVPVAKAISEMR